MWETPEGTGSGNDFLNRSVIHRKQHQESTHWITSDLKASSQPRKQQSEVQPTEWEKFLARCSSDGGSIPRIYKEQQQK